MGLTSVDLLFASAGAPGGYDAVGQRLRGYLRRHSIKEVARITGAQVRTVEGWFAGDALPGWRHMVPLIEFFGRSFVLDVFAPLFDDDSFDRRLAEATAMMISLQQDYADATRMAAGGLAGAHGDGASRGAGRLGAAARSLGVDVGRCLGLIGRAGRETLRAAGTSVRGLAVGVMLATVALQATADADLWRAPVAKSVRYGGTANAKRTEGQA